MDAERSVAPSPLRRGVSVQVDPSVEPTVEVKTSPAITVLRNIFGLVDGRSFWGLEPIDLRPSLSQSTIADVEEASTRERTHSTDGGAHDHHAVHNYQVPQRRHVWGEKQYSLQAGWGELFLDLVFVGAAYRLGGLIRASFYSCKSYESKSAGSGAGYDLASGLYDAVPSSSCLSKPPCVGLGLGVLFACALFQTMTRLWLADLHYRARFDATDRFHRLLDVIGYFLLILGAANIHPVHEYADFSSLSAFVLPCVVLQGAWVLRWLEIALLSHDEESRRFSSLRVVDELPCVLCWLAALLAHCSLDEPNLAIGLLLLVGGLWPDVRLMLRVQRAVVLHAIDPAGSTAHMSKDRTRVPLNVEFAIHRLNELMMLMIGETVLQLVLAEHKTSGSSDDSYWYATLLSGYILSLSMLYSFNITEPHKAQGHAMSRSSRAAALFLLSIPPKATSILLAGVGVKIALYNPIADARGQTALQQRIQLSAAVASCFVLQLLRQALHTGFLAYFSVKSRTRFPLRVPMSFARLSLCVVMFATSWLELLPWRFVLLQAALAVMVCLLHFSEQAWQRKPPAESPPRQRPSARATGRYSPSEGASPDRRSDRSSSTSWSPFPRVRTSTFSGIQVPISPSSFRKFARRSRKSPA